MQYNSTRNASLSVCAAQAIAQGISVEGGLFVPQSFPTLTQALLQELTSLSYTERAKRILAMFLSDFTAEEVDECAEKAYNTGRFRHEAVAPLHYLDDSACLLELWHGPTCAFKDMALQILPHLMRTAASKTADGREIVILVATSGDTGKAALEGFRDAEHTKILVFYPEDGVSPMQKLQMVTQEGGNVGVCAIRGNFDTAQTGVKTIFTDPALKQLLADNNMMFSSANSINWGRLLPQIVYYISAYCDLCADGKLQMGQPMNVCVPTGNFGNILAAYYARKMGLPVARFICASNRNRILSDFISTGVYDCNRDFYTTTSPSMDILISSNLERLLFDLADGNDGEIVRLMSELKEKKCYTVSPAMLEKLQALFSAGWCDDEEVAATIRDTFKDSGYLCDTHTAVALRVYRQYRERTGDITPTVIASTANPYKFSASVLDALGASDATLDEFAKVEKLSELTGTEIPSPLAGLQGKTVRFSEVCDRDAMQNVVLGMLGIEA